MSKKRGKPAAGKTPTRRTARKAVSRPRTVVRSAETAGGRTIIATIVLFRTERGNRIRTSPQRLYANPGDHVEWNVVNLIDGSDVPVTISWPDGGPWGKAPIEIRSWERKPFGNAPAGRYKYVVTAMGAQEDPEIELPEGN